MLIQGVRDFLLPCVGDQVLQLERKKSASQWVMGDDVVKLNMNI